jgi:dTMP kinase
VKPGSFLVVEGIDGAGKSTQVERLVAALRADGHDVLATREPTDGPVGRRIREMARAGQKIEPAQELAWFMEDRDAHVQSELAPALAAGRSVVCDRYFLSTVAYQGGRGLDWRAILAESEARFPIPDLALILEIDAAAGLARARSRGGTADPDFENQAFLERVAAIFAELDRPWIVRVDARADARTVTEHIRTAVGI